MAQPEIPHGDIDFLAEDIGEIATKDPKRIFAAQNQIAYRFGKEVALKALMLAIRSRIELENCLNCTGC